MILGGYKMEVVYGMLCSMFFIGCSLLVAAIYLWMIGGE